MCYRHIFCFSINCRRYVLKWFSYLFRNIYSIFNKTDTLHIKTAYDNSPISSPRIAKSPYASIVVIKGEWVHAKNIIYQKVRIIKNYFHFVWITIYPKLDIVFTNIVNVHTCVYETKVVKYKWKDLDITWT